MWHEQEINVWGLGSVGYFQSFIEFVYLCYSGDIPCRECISFGGYLRSLVLMISVYPLLWQLCLLGGISHLEQKSGPRVSTMSIGSVPGAHIKPSNTSSVKQPSSVLRQCYYLLQDAFTDATFPVLILFVIFHSFSLFVDHLGTLLCRCSDSPMSLLECGVWR